MAVGSSSPYNIKAELYDLVTGVWTAVPDYPYGNGVIIAGYDIVYVPATSAYYVIGGYDSWHPLTEIAMFKNGVWSEAGQLNTARSVSLCFFFCFKITDSILSITKLYGQTGL